MAFDLEKLEKISQPSSKSSVEHARWRRENRKWLRMSQDIALGLHYHLRTKGITQKDFAETMGVSPVYVGKLLKGTENLTLETISKIQSALGEVLVSVARPYVKSRIINISQEGISFMNGTESERFRKCQSTNKYYVSAKKRQTLEVG